LYDFTSLPIIVVYHNVRLANIIIMIRVAIRTAAAALNVNQFSGLILSKPFRDEYAKLYYNNKRIKPAWRKSF